ncbi:MAG: ATP-dependent sacrificial sulfur transferase LarE [Clostridiales bacterium]|jgi:uncharacterized protein|nr:ATP-dependent sacrificial sulfur transferase LarE [Clostridiales bacterium]
MNEDFTVEQDLTKKYQCLHNYLQSLGSLAVAFSGGVDSTFLLKAAHQALGDKAVAITAHSPSFPLRELKEAQEFCQKENIRHYIFASRELDNEGFRDNPPNRCYICKKEILGNICQLARRLGLQAVGEGSNLDDDNDYRPGRQAAVELGVKSPLREVGLNKEEIRLLSRSLDLPTWEKPSFACLASRFPYGEKISHQRLAMVDQAEQLLLNLGLAQVRVRYHGNLARIECDQPGFALLANEPLRREIYSKLRQIGFTYIALDLLGYRTGSLNEQLGSRN